MWLSRHVSVTIFPHVSLSRRVMIVLRRSLYGVVSDGRVLGLFLILPPPFLIGFDQEAIISLEAGFGLIMFPVLCLPFFTQYQSTWILVPTSMRTK